MGYFIPFLLDAGLVPKWHVCELTFGERVERVYELEFCVSAQGDHLVHLFELGGDDAEPLHELVQTHLPQVVVLFPVSKMVELLRSQH